MRRWMSCLATAVRFALIEQLRNRLALVILVFFVPLWITLGYKVMADDPVRFFVRPADRSITLDGNIITQMSGALHSLALIVGFMMFLATARSVSFDRRLVMAGYPRLCLGLAKFTALLLAAATVAAYGAVWMRMYWRPQQLLLLAVGLFLGALIYGGIGVMLAAVLRSELAGMFLVIMISFIDLSLQNPIANPAADSPVLRYFPAYGAMQTVVTAGGLDMVPWRELAMGVLWAVGTAATGMAAFALRSCSRRIRNATRVTRAGSGRSVLRRTWPADSAVTDLVDGARTPLADTAGTDAQAAREADVKPSGLRRPGTCEAPSSAIGRPVPRWVSPLLRSRSYRKAAIRDRDLVRCYEICRLLVRRSGRVDYAITQLLPPQLRPLMWAVYSHGRVMDDLADAPGDSSAVRSARVEAYGHALEADVRRGHSEDPVRHAVVHALWTWDLPTENLFSWIAEYLRDARGREGLATWADWHTYWNTLSHPFSVNRLAALVSGSYVSLGPRDAEALHRWTDAFNLIDALRDMREDARDRYVLLPQEVLDEYGVTSADIGAGRHTPQLTSMMEHLVATAHQWLDQAASFGTDHPGLTSAWQTLIALHRLQLRAIERNQHTLPARPPSASRLTLWWTLTRGRLRTARAWRRSPLLPAVPSPAVPSPVPRTEPAVAVPHPRPDDILQPPKPHNGGALPPTFPEASMPRHVAVIMDGNGRWATGRGLPRPHGHLVGQQALRDVIYGALEIGLPYLTVYALSTENIQRPAEEIDAILGILRDSTDLKKEECLHRDVRLRWSGSPDALPPDLVEHFQRTVHHTRHRTGLNLTVCVNYGGRAEITQASRALAREAVSGRIDPDHITTHRFASHLNQPDLPDVDLLIRTGGEQRVSNFLPWQSIYAELAFLDTLWPDIDRRHLWQAIDTYTRRKRRYGGVRPHTGLLR